MNTSIGSAFDTVTLNTTTATVGTVTSTITSRATTTGEVELNSWDNDFRPTITPNVVFKTRVRDNSPASVI